MKWPIDTIINFNKLSLNIVKIDQSDQFIECALIESLNSVFVITETSPECTIPDTEGWRDAGRWSLRFDINGGVVVVSSPCLCCTIVASLVHLQPVFKCPVKPVKPVPSASVV